MSYRFFSSMKFTTKLFAAVFTLCVTSIVIVSGNAIWMSREGLLTLGKDAIEHMNEAVFNSLRSYDETIGRKLDSDLKVFEKEVLGKGSLQIDNINSQQRKVTNQVSQQTEQISLPQLLAGATPLADSNDIVDILTAQTGSLATVFQLVGDKLLRVATTVKNLQGERAVGTYVPSDSPVFKAIA